MNEYGKSLILDIHDCDISKFNRKDIRVFFKLLCKKIEMKRGPLHFWDFQGRPEEKEKVPPHLKGTSACQFIYTSNIIIHALDDLKCVYIDLFSCKDFDENIVAEFVIEYFGGKVITQETHVRI